MYRTPASPSRMPAAPASFSMPSAGSQRLGTPTLTELPRAKSARVKSAMAAPMLAAAAAIVMAAQIISMGMAVSQQTV